MKDDQKSLIAIIQNCIENLDVSEEQKKVLLSALEVLFCDSEIDLESIVDEMLGAGLIPVAPIPELSKLYDEMGVIE